jgi:hypothetical protein
MLRLNGEKRRAQLLLSPTKCILQPAIGRTGKEKGQR